MKNKKKLGVLSLVFAAGLLLGACNTKKPSSSSPAEDSSQEVTKYTVTFVVEGKTVATKEVEEGQLATYDGATPTKPADAEAFRYGFRGWDKDIKSPITADTTFTATFAPYVEEAMIGDFESFTETAEMKEAGWCAIGWGDSGWTKDTKAAVSLGTRSQEGAKALRFDSWTNGVGYKIAKEFQANEFTKALNALKFRLMTPAANTIKVLLNGQVTVAGEKMDAYFSYEIRPTTSEYVEYVIPFDAPEWKLWGEDGKSMVEVADYIGVHQDDVVKYLTSIEFLLQGSANNGASCVSFLDSARFVTLDNAQRTETEALNQYTQFTGTTASGNTVRIDILDNELNATAKVIDIEEPVTIPGKIAVDGHNMTFTSADQGTTLIYRGKATNAGAKINFVSAEGALKDEVNNMVLDAVQTVENFDQYTEDGVSYNQSTTIAQRKGCRGAYYSEYYTDKETDSSPWGGTKWLLMGGSGDQLKLLTNGGHSGQQYVSLKNSQGKAMRYMQWGLFDGTSEQKSFRGSHMGFWAKTNGLVKKFHVYAFSKSNPTATDLANGTGFKKVTFEETAAVGAWKHYEIDINPGLVYYGYMITIEPNWTADSYLFVDDVEIYTASPYATYVPPEPEPEPEIIPGLYYTAKVNGVVGASLSFGSDNSVSLAAPGLSVNLNGTYALVDDELTLTFPNMTYVGTLEENNTKITYKSVSGDNPLKPYLQNLSFDMIPYADNAETYAEDGKMYYQGNLDESQISGARGAYYCDYYTGNESNTSPLSGKGWSLMGGSGDQLKLDKTGGCDGNQSLQMKWSSAGKMRYIQWDLFKGTAKGRTGYNCFKIAVKNTSSANVPIKIWVFQNAKVDANNITQRASLETTVEGSASGYTIYSVALDPTKTYYGYGIFMDYKPSSGSGYINFDFAYFCNDYEDPTNMFYAYKDLQLNGTIVPGAASIKFNNGGKFNITCENAGWNNVEGTYTMYCEGMNQKMKLVVNGTTIIGNYVVNAATSEITFTVTSAEGAAAAHILADTVFSNQ